MSYILVSNKGELKHCPVQKKNKLIKNIESFDVMKIAFSLKNTKGLRME